MRNAAPRSSAAFDRDFFQNPFDNLPWLTGDDVAPGLEAKGGNTDGSTKGGGSGGGSDSPTKGKKGGGDTSGGTDTSTGGSTGGDTSGGGTTGGGTTGGGTSGGTSSGGGWDLAPPTGDSALPTDTYFKQQWALNSATAGINVTKVWQNYTGEGVKVGVIDTGIDYLHSDLAPNYLSALDYDSVGRDYDPYYAQSSEYHATNVAGVIAAANNGTGIVGVAYDAGIAGYRAIGGGSISEAFYQARINGMDVVNNSWGYSTPFADNYGTSGPSFIRDAVSLGRDGLGMNVVFSAGNYRTSGDNVNYHSFKNSPYAITVAATDSSGKVASWSSPGAAILVSAPGASIMTTDVTGADGKSSGDYVTNSGTSFAAPHVSGVVALMLQANADLGYRDVMEILAYSARKTDAASSGWATNGAATWNGGGLHFSHDYGFGLVDAFAAVRLAESWQAQSTYANLVTLSATNATKSAIPDGSGSLKSTITLAGGLDIDRMVVDLNITHAMAKDLVVTLTSPSGTTALLIAQPANGVGGGIVFSTTANNFWGEDTAGSWTLTVTDKVAGNTGTLNSWTLKALGDSADAPNVYIYTDEFATITGATRFVLNDSSGTAMINTAAVTSNSTIDLHAGATSTIAGRAVQIGADTVIKSVWAGDGNDLIIGNDYGNTIQSGRGNDTIKGGAGNDDLHGGPGDDAIYGGAGHDFLWGEAGNDQLFGGAGSDRLAGGADNGTWRYDPADLNFAGLIVGDRLSGGADADIFFYGFGDGVDLVLDFTRGLDMFEIQGYAADQVRFLGGIDYTVIGFVDASGNWLDNAAIQVMTITDLSFADLRFV